MSTPTTPDPEQVEPTPAQKHYAEAERLLELADGRDPEWAQLTVATAQVHATLAQAASNEQILSTIAMAAAETLASVIEGVFGG